MTTILPHSTSDLLAQGIQALKTGETAAARELLVQVLQSDAGNLQAWLWLSGAVTTPGERRYCLEQVLVVDPQHSAARRGLALLPSDLASVSPLPAPLPGWLADDFVPPAPEPVQTAPVHSAAAQPAPALQPVSAHSEQAAAIASALTFSLPSHWDAPAEPAPSAAFSTAAPSVSPAPAAPDQTYHQHDIDLVIKLFGSHYNRDQIARKLSEEYGLAWDDANGLIEHVEMYHSQRVAARQSPILLGIGIVLLLGGLASVIYGLPAVFRLLDSDVGGLAYSARYTARQLQAFGVGIMMVLGSLIGMGQTIRSLWK